MYFLNEWFIFLLDNLPTAGELCSVHHAGHLLDFQWYISIIPAWMAHLSMILSNYALRSSLYAKRDAKHVQYVMQIELYLPELAKCTNMKLLLAISFNFSSPCVHAVLNNVFKTPCREVPSVSHALCTREMFHPLLKRNRVWGSRWWCTHRSCGLCRGRMWQLLLQGSLTQPSSAVAATHPFAKHILHPDMMHSSIKTSELHTIQ